jgi:hypothetical protein
VELRNCSTLGSSMCKALTDAATFAGDIVDDSVVPKDKEPKPAPKGRHV